MNQPVKPMNLEMIKQTLASMDPYGPKLKPYLQLLESISQELERTHATLQARIQQREGHFDDDKALEKLREHYLEAIEQFGSALLNCNAKTETRNYDNAPQV